METIKINEYFNLCERVAQNIKRAVPAFDTSKIVNLLCLECKSVDELKILGERQLDSETIEYIEKICKSAAVSGKYADCMPIGVPLTIFVTSQKLQKVLNVKRADDEGGGNGDGADDEDGNVLDKIISNKNDDGYRPYCIAENILPSDDIFKTLNRRRADGIIWIRLHVSRNIADEISFRKSGENCAIKFLYWYKFNDEYYEYYFHIDDRCDPKKKLKRMTATCTESEMMWIEYVNEIVEMDAVLELLFMSDLRIAKRTYPEHVVFSMIFIFLSVYWNQSHDVVYTSSTSLGLLYMQILAFLFLYNDDFNFPPDNNPLMKNTGERALNGLSKVQKYGKEQIYTMNTPRCYANIGEKVGCGSRVMGESIVEMSLDPILVGNRMKYKEYRENLEKLQVKCMLEMNAQEQEINNRNIRKEDFEVNDRKRAERKSLIPKVL